MKILFNALLILLFSSGVYSQECTYKINQTEDCGTSDYLCKESSKYSEIKTSEVDGKTFEEFIILYPDGSINAEGSNWLSYDDCFNPSRTPHGKRITYWRNGIMQSQSNYQNGIKIGLSQSFDSETGDLTQEINRNEKGQKHGVTINRSFITSELRRTNFERYTHSKTNYTNGKQDGLYQVFFSDGSLKKEFNYKEGEFHGLNLSYFENGNIETKWSWGNGKKDGLHESFYESGKPSSSINYKLGRLHGFSKTFNQEGILVSEVEYKDGRRIQ